MKNASVRQLLSMEPLPFPCHPDRSEAERRDLRFYGPFLGMFSRERRTSAIIKIVPVDIPPIIVA